MRLVALILLLCPALAWADPISITVGLIEAGASAGLAAGIANVVVFAAEWGSVIFTAGSMLYGSAAQRKQAKAAKRAASRAAAQARDEFNASLRDRTISGVSTEAPWRYIYGEARVGAQVVAIFTSGARDEYKHIVAVLAQHECEAIDGVYLNGQLADNFDKTDTGSKTEVFYTASFTLEKAPNAGSLSVIKNTYIADSNENQPWTVIQEPVAYTLAGQTITITSGEDAEYTATYQWTTVTAMARVIKHLGGAGDPADATLISECPGKWRASDVLRDHAYIYIRLNLNQADFQGGIPQIEAVVRGKKLYDPRTGLTAYSANNALVAYDFLTSEMGGVPSASIPLSSFIAAANDCDDIVSTGAWSGTRYTFNGTITSDQSRDDVLEKIAQSMAGGIVATTWDIYAGKYSAPVMALTQADIVGEIAISPGLPLSDVFNTVKGQFICRENIYVATDYAPYVNAAYLAADGEELVTNIDFPYTDIQQRCTNLARIFTEDNRNGFSMNGKFSLKTWSLKVGQRVTFTSSLFGQNAKVFRLTDKSFAPDRCMQLGFKEDAPSIYDLADEVSIDATPNTDLPNPFAITPLASLTCQSGASALLLQNDGSIVSRIQATWPLATTQGVLQNGLIEIEWQRLGDADWQKTTTSGDATSAYLSPVQDAQFYTVRARCVNTYLNVKSDWTYAALHKVIGKTDPPANVTGFTIEGNKLTWSPVADIDLAGYLVKFQYGANTEWGTANRMHAGLLTSSPYTMLIVPPGEVTIMIRAVDTSGNESQTSAYIITDLGDPLVANVIESFDYKAASWPGAFTNATIVGGDLEATQSDPFYKADLSNFYGEAGAPFYGSNFDAIEWVSDGWKPSAAAAGSNMTVAWSATGNALQIQYRPTGPSSFYRNDLSEFYRDDDESFYDAPPDWMGWPGSITAQNREYQWRVTTSTGPVTGSISQFTASVDVPDKTLALNGVAIGSGGTRLSAAAGQFNVIQNVQLTLQGGSTAMSLEIRDKSITLGPMIDAFNASHIGVSATIDALIQGY